jgi:phosphoribosylglycinamide formyltransferase-1
VTARLAVCISGGGRTLLNLADRIDAGRLDAEIALVIASRECAGADRALARGLPVVVEPGDIPAARLGALLREARAEWVVLAGYLRLLPIPPGFEGRVVNIHPALLPAFGGRGMHGERVHRAVLDAGCKVSGCTVHLCDDRYDTGPIILQRACEVRDDDTPETLGARVFDLETEALPDALALLLSGAVDVEGRRTRRHAPAKR